MFRHYSLCFLISCEYKMLLKLVCLLLLAGKGKECNGNVVADFHWTFDFNDDDNVYVASSATENVGNMGDGTSIVGSSKRYGSVAYFSGTNSGILVKDLTSSCFLNPSSCLDGLTFSFWINWVKFGTDPLVMSPSIGMKHVMDQTVVLELWNGTTSWAMFHYRKTPLNGVWQQYTISWDRRTLKIFVDGKKTDETNVTSLVRNGLIGSAATAHPTRIAFGRSSTDVAGSSLVQMFLDDFKIWETSLNDDQVSHIYKSGIYNENLFIREDTSSAIQFISCSSNGQYTMRTSSVIAEHPVNNLQSCYKLCTNELNCKSVGFWLGSSSSICKIGTESLVPGIDTANHDGFYYYSVFRDV